METLSEVNLNNYKGQRMLHRAEDINNFWALKKTHNLNSDLTLLDNVQFIYELSLAEMELHSLGAKFKLNNGLRDFKLLNPSEELENILIKKSSYFKAIKDKFTDYFYIIQKNVTRSVNQYLTHWIYPYKGKFHPQMIRALINIIGLKEGDLLFEPFSGSGTTALEAQLLGVDCIGIDISPLCVLQGRVKTNSIYVVDEIKNLKEEIISKSNISLFNKEADFYKVVEPIKNINVKEFFILARLVAISDSFRRKRDFRQSFIKNLNLMIKSIEYYQEIKELLSLKLGKIEIKIGDARKVDLPDNSVDGIITSPPYSIALDYVENDAHSLNDLGYYLTDMREKFIGVRGKGKFKIELYNEDMKKAYNEMYRVLKPGRYAVIVIGNATYQGKEIPTVDFTIDYMENLGFKLEKNIPKIIFGLYNMMKKENILIFKKEI